MSVRFVSRPFCAALLLAFGMSLFVTGCGDSGKGNPKADSKGDLKPSDDKGGQPAKQGGNTPGAQ